MAYLYSLYDALVSISVPSDKARAVVDAMERDMGATLATKQDLELLRLATKQDIDSLRQATKQDFDSLRQETKQDFDSLRQAMKHDIDSLRQETKQDIESLRQETRQEFALVRQELAGVQKDLSREFENRCALLAQDIGAQTLRMTVRFGSMLFLGLGLTLAVLRLWSS